MSKTKIRTIFMGTPEFAVPGLQSLIADSNFDIVAVFTQPDKAVGRKQTITPPPVKEVAEINNISVCQPIRIRTEIELVKELRPDLIVVIAYGHIIPQPILDIPKHGCINVHASLLPKYRGAACLNAPIRDGEKETGITIMEMEAGLDTGPIIKQEKVAIDKEETLSTLHDKLSKLAAITLPDTLLDYINGNITATPQDDADSSYIGLLKKEDGLIDWNRPAIEIERLVRALNPWPGTYTHYSDKTLKIKKVSSEILDINKHKTGQTFKENDKLCIQCGQDSLVILSLQTEGKKEMNDKEFLNGNQDFINTILS